MEQGEQRVWWSVPETGFNAGWPRPEFALGEMVWWRSDPREATHIIGVSYCEAWFDEEAQEENAPYWEFEVTGRGGWWPASSFVGRADHAVALSAWKEQQAALPQDDFNPFLEPDESLP